MPVPVRHSAPVYQSPGWTQKTSPRLGQFQTDVPSSIKSKEPGIGMGFPQNGVPDDFSGNYQEQRCGEGEGEARLNICLREEFKLESRRQPGRILRLKFRHILRR